MTTQSDNHDNVFEQVETYLEELFEDIYHDPETDHFYVRYGSTVVEISVEPYGPEEVVVLIVAYCVQGIEVDESLMRGLLELNHSLPFGTFSLVGNDIFVHQALFGRTLARPNLLNAIASVATTSDEWDDLLVGKFGGERALDRIRHTGGREQRRAKTAAASPAEW